MSEPIRRPDRARSAPRARRLRALCALPLLAAAASGSWSSRAFAAEPGQTLDQAQFTLANVDKSIGDIEKAVAAAKFEERSPEARLLDGELVLRGKDYERAAIIFSEVIEKFATHQTVVPDAMMMLGETYYESKEYLSARRAFRRIVDRVGEPRFASYQARALERLVDIALRTQTYDALDEVFAKMSQLPPQSIESGIAYARGKGLFVRNDWAGARTALQSVAPQSRVYPQARYLLGVIAIKEAAPAGATVAASRGRFTQAIEAFRQAAALPRDTPEHAHVGDLAWLAIGRLYYETEQYLEAADAYTKVERESPEFGTALYELAWVYVRVGDADRAQRALEVLAVADPNGSNIADGTLLRADLMLRAGQFDKALALYQGVRAQYDPIREKVDAFLLSTSDPAVYYDKLAKEQLEQLDQSTLLPPLAVQWAREAENGPSAFAVLAGAQSSRKMLRQASGLVDKLGMILAAPNRVRAFPELRVGEEKALAMMNSITRARGAVGETLDAVEAPEVGPELAKVRDERRALQARLARLPVGDSDFSSREDQAQRQWNTLSQRLQQLTLQVDGMHAIINGLRRAIAEGSQHGVVRDPASVERFQIELGQNEHDLGLYRQMIAEMRRLVEAGKLQVGFGDQRFVEDADLRSAFRRALGDEVRLAAGGAGGREAVAWAQRAAPLLAQAEASDARLDAAYADIERRVEQRAGEVKQILDAETQNLARYATTLDTLDAEARLVVGQVAMKNFGIVRDRLKEIVLRADVGVTEEAWELREEELGRVRRLQLERSRSEQQLNEELREVLDDMGEPDKGAAPPGGQK